MSKVRVVRGPARWRRQLELEDLREEISAECAAAGAGYPPEGPRAGRRFGTHWYPSTAASPDRSSVIALLGALFAELGALVWPLLSKSKGSPRGHPRTPARLRCTVTCRAWTLHHATASRGLCLGPRYTCATNA